MTCLQSEHAGLPRGAGGHAAGEDGAMLDGELQQPPQRIVRFFTRIGFHHLHLHHMHLHHLNQLNLHHLLLHHMHNLHQLHLHHLHHLYLHHLR